MKWQNLLCTARRKEKEKSNPSHAQADTLSLSKGRQEI